jgi:hypothetical protein
MQNKANLGIDKMNITIDMTNNYEILSRCLRRKNKPNSNPIKPNSNPIQSQFKANYRKGKNERFCVDKELYYCFNNATRGSYHP